MIRRRVLSALAAGIAAGDEDAARAALQQTEWVLRGRARRRLEQALIDAALETNELGTGNADAARHVQRVAALGLARVKLDVFDRERVIVAYAALPVPRVSTLPIMTLALVLAVAALGVVIVKVAATASRTPRAVRTAEGYVRPLTPPPAGAFKDGGVPARDEAIEKLLLEDFTAFVIDTDAQRRRAAMHPERNAELVALERAAAIAARGPELVAAWSDMLAALERWVHVPVSSQSFDDIARELRAKVRVVSDQLAAAGIGLYLEGDVLTFNGAAHAIIYSYRVEQVVFVVAGGTPRRVLSLRRLDRLNLTHALLGMQSEELGDPVVLLDQIDAHVTRVLVPLLARDTPYPLGDEDWQRSEAGHLAVAAGTVVRRELAAVLGADVTGPTAPAAIAKLVVATVRRHEAQHGVDDDRVPDGPLRYPPALEALLGDELDQRGMPRPSVERTRAELAAYLSQIANDPVTPQLSLWQVAHHVFDRHRWGTAESYAGVLIVEGLARQLHVAQAGPVIHDGAIDRTRLLEPAVALVTASDDQLRAAARALWTELYDEPFVPIVDN